jgi:hypothetical protein
MEKYKYSLSRQFNERCLNMSAWAKKHGISRALLTQIAAGVRVGKRKGKTREIIELLKQDGFVVETQKAA